MKAILFDLDNTLYAPECDLFSLIDVRINRFMADSVAIDADQVDYLRRKYWDDYGATLQGLIRHHNVDAEDYLDYIHDIDVSGRILRDDSLRRSLSDLPVAPSIFTNASRCHADRVLGALGVAQCFNEIFDIRVADYQPKPNPEPYRKILAYLGLHGGDCVMVEDHPQNLKTAKELGMKTVLVDNSDKPAGYSYVDVRVALPDQVAGVLKQWAAA